VADPEIEGSQVDTTDDQREGAGSNFFAFRSTGPGKSAKHISPKISCLIDNSTIHFKPCLGEA